MWGRIVFKNFKIPKISIKQFYFDLDKRGKNEQRTARYDLLKIILGKAKHVRQTYLKKPLK